VIAEILKTDGAEAEVGEVIGRLAHRPGPGCRPAATAARCHVGPPGGDARRAAGARPGRPRPRGCDGHRPGGRVLKEDAQRAAAAPPPPVVAEAEPASAPASTDGYRATERVKMTPMRRKIAARLVEAQQTAALLTTFNEIDLSEVMALRKAWQEDFTKQHGIRLGFMSFFVKACVDALRRFPAINAAIEGQEIVYHDYYDIGIAVSGPKGLAVPIIRNAERLGFAEIEQTIADFGVRAKDNKLELHELEGGTFTITNGGIFGSLLSTPIVNPPQSGILGMHAIQERPVAVEGQVVIRPMMYVALTYDHRIVDGREAVTFLKRIKEAVEHPARMLIEV